MLYICNLPNVKLIWESEGKHVQAYKLTFWAVWWWTSNSDTGSSYPMQGSGGVTIKKTGQALVFGVYDEPVTPGQCNMIVERLGDYLIEQGL